MILDLDEIIASAVGEVEQTSLYIERFGCHISVDYLKELEAKIINLIGKKATEALELGMIPAELIIEDKNGEHYRIPYMEARDVIMLRDPNAMVWISRNFKEFDCHNFATVNLVDVEREFLYKQFTREYEDGPLFTTRDSCAYATDRMIGFQKMIGTLFCGQPMDKILPLESISDLEIREAVCNLYNIGLDANANLLKIQPNEVDD